MTQGPLVNIRVLDLTDELGAYCPKLLADLGADVLKVEPPEGAPGRRRGPFAGDQPGPDRSLWWAFYNTNKRNLTLDLQSEDGRSRLVELTKSADVLTVSSLPRSEMTCAWNGATASGQIKPLSSWFVSMIVWTARPMPMP